MFHQILIILKLQTQVVSVFHSNNFPLDLNEDLYTFQSELKMSDTRNMVSNKITFDFPVKF